MESIYVHYDSVSNHIVSSGVRFSTNTIPPILIPKNILLLKGKSKHAIYDDYTGFSYIREGKVREFLLEENLVADFNWIDFESIEFLHQLTPQEVADLLYISHTNTHLHSPFFYKLQNNYIYLTMEEQFTKVYYRKIQQFFLLLSKDLTKQMREVVNGFQKRLFFKKQKEIQPISAEQLMQSSAWFKEGLIFAPQYAVQENTRYKIPIFVAEDHYQDAVHMKERNEHIGFISYDDELGEWEVQIDSWFDEN